MSQPAASQHLRELKEAGEKLQLDYIPALYLDGHMLLDKLVENLLPAAGEQFKDSVCEESCTLKP